MKVFSSIIHFYKLNKTILHIYKKSKIYHELEKFILLWIFLIKLHNKITSIRNFIKKKKKEKNDLKKRSLYPRRTTREIVSGNFAFSAVKVASLSPIPRFHAVPGTHRRGKNRIPLSAKGGRRVLSPSS